MPSNSPWVIVDTSDASKKIIIIMFTLNSVMRTIEQ